MGHLILTDLFLEQEVDFPMSCGEHITPWCSQSPLQRGANAYKRGGERGGEAE